MGLIHIMERSGDNDVRRFEESLHMAKEGLMQAVEIFDDMKAQFSSRYDQRYDQRNYGERNDRGYGERNGSYMRGGSYRDGEYGGMDERRSRDSMGRYR